MLPAQRPATQDYSSRIRLVFGLIQGPRRVIERRTVLIHTLLQSRHGTGGTRRRAATGPRTEDLLLANSLTVRRRLSKITPLHTQCVSRTYEVTQATDTGHTFP